MVAPPRFPYRFFVVTFLWSWTDWLPLVLAGFHLIPVAPEFLARASMPALVLAAFGPGIGALYSLWTLGNGRMVRNYLRGVFDLRIGWSACLAPVILIGGSSCAAWLLPELWGARHLDFHFALLASPLNLLIIALFAGSREELGWRGYILDPLEERLGPFFGSLVLGLIWAAWHLPLFLDAVPPLSFLLLTTGYSWFFFWIRKVSDQRTFSGIYAHACINVFGSLFPIGDHARYWLWVSFALVIGLMTISISFRRSRPTRAVAAAQS